VGCELSRLIPLQLRRIVFYSRLLFSFFIARLAPVHPKSPTGIWGTDVPVAGGKFSGMILRNQIITMLQNQCWGERHGHTTTQPALTYVASCHVYRRLANH
jgi:hypothetical protein